MLFLQAPEIFDNDHLNLPLAQRQQRRQIHLPRQFVDDLPENLLPIPPPEVLVIPISNSFVLKSPCNIYGLFRRYHARTNPLHDPDSDLTMDDICDVLPSNAIPTVAPESSQNIPHTYGPYPNKSSFLLGEWNWNDQVQKSKSTFKSLIDIVGDPDFRPADICDTQWDVIDDELGSSEINVDPEEEACWIKDDAIWKSTSITIPVPFHRYTENPGPRDYVISEFYHRSIISILRETLSHSAESLQFHYEPYELYWQRNKNAKPARVYGELYTSPIFIEAYRTLQESSPEPGCCLPRVVVGLMLASDATHLTSFGNAKIWPQYLYFGNHSKYHRCKPNCHLCYHVAYFHKVSYMVVQKACFDN